MTEYWLISAPGDKTCQQTWETMNNLTSKQQSLSSNYKFHIPDLKVGTLDQLVGLSDDLGKLDTFVEQVTRKVAAYLGEVLEDQRDKLHENLMANNSQTSMDGDTTSPDGLEGGPETPPNTPVSPSHKTTTTSSKDHHHHHRHVWKDSDIQQEHPTAPSIGQHHQRHHRHHQRHQNHRNHHCSSSTSSYNYENKSHHHHQHQHRHHHHHHHNPISENKNKSSSTNIIASSSQGSSDVRTPNESSIYSCYQVHWCATTSASSSPSPSPTPSSPCPSYYDSSDCSTDSDTALSSRQRRSTDAAATSKRRKSKKLSHRKTSTGSKKSLNDNYPDDDDLAGHYDHADHHNTDEDDGDDDLSGKLPNPGDLPTYITRFQWDMAKYPIKQSLRNIADIISKQVGQIDADLKTKSTTYNNLKGSLQNLEKKQTGSLLTRNLADLVKKEHFILDSEYLSTLLVIVPKSSFHEWHAIYEKLTDMIVPRSTQLITQDAEYGLFTVTLFKKVIEEFKLHAREKKFIVRDFTYNEEELAAGKNEITKLVTDKKKQFGPLVRWLKVNFSECFCAWIHVKALRVFVESVLRYGLPVNFQAILLHPHKKCTKRLRDVLNQLYAHLDSSAAAGGHGGNQDSVDIPGLGFGQNEYFPYVYYKINVDMVDNKV